MNKINGVVLIGPPGSGKSDIGRIAVKEFPNMVYVSSGDIARNIAQNDILTRSFLSKGKLAPEDMMRQRIHQALYRINAAGKEFMMDGCPRNIEQLIWLLSLFPSIKFYYIRTDRDTCIQRLGRRHRSDDTIEVVNKRMEYYDTHTKQILSHVDYTVVPNDLPSHHAAKMLKFNIGREIYGIED